MAAGNGNWKLCLREFCVGGGVRFFVLCFTPIFKRNLSEN